MQEWQDLVDNHFTSNNDCITENPRHYAYEGAGLGIGTNPRWFLGWEHRILNREYSLLDRRFPAFYIDRFNVEPSDSFQEFV